MTPKTDTEEFGHGAMRKNGSRSYETLAEKVNEEQEMMSWSLQLERSNTAREGRPAMHARAQSMITEQTPSTAGNDLDKKDDASASKRGWLGGGRLGGLRPASKGVKEVKGKPGQKLSILRKDREDTGKGVGVP
jgi:hypothetical protein